MMIRPPRSSTAGHRSRQLVAGVLTLSLLAACGGDGSGSGSEPPGDSTSGGMPAPEGDPVMGGTLAIVEGATAPHINPYPTGTIAGMATHQFNSLMYETLLTRDADGNVVAGGASLSDSYEQPDPTTVVVRIREGVKFHSGAEMTAQDVAFTYTHAAQTTALTTAAALQSLASAEATDTTTVTFTLHRPDSGFIPLLANDALPVIEQAWTEEHDGDLNAFPNGTGAFRFVSFTPNDSFSVERFEDYWDPELPYLDGVDVLTMPDVATRMAAVRTGEADIVEFPWDQGELLGTLDDVTVIEPAPLLGEPLRLSCTIPPTDDVRVRQAVMYSLDLPAIAAQVGPGSELPLSYVVPPDLPRWGVPVGDEFPYAERDLDRARSLLAEAGHADGISIDVTILSSPAFDYNRRTVELAAQQAAEAGITLNIVPQDLATALASASQGTLQANQLGLPVGDDVSAILSSTLAASTWGCTDEHIQGLIAADRETADESNREERIAEILEYATEQVYSPILYSRPARLTVVSEGVSNYTPVPQIRWSSARETWKVED